MKFLKKTKSLCPQCLHVIPADLVEENGQVLIRKECPEHGSFEDVYWSDYKLWEWANSYNAVGGGLENPRTETKAGCPMDCGICPNHKSHTVLSIIDVTNRCNLACPICFAHAGATGYLYEPTQEQIKEMLLNLKRNLPVPTNALQFSGGEPTIREDLPDLIQMAKEVGIDHIEVNTNGIRISKDPEYLKSLIDAGVSTFYLQFDGLTPEPYIQARGLDLLPVKKKAIENARKVGCDSIVLVPTLVRGVNDGQIGDIIRFAVANSDVVRGVNFQPVSITGRIDRAKQKEMRITIPDFWKLCEAQTGGQIKVSDFYPIPVVLPVSLAMGALKNKRYPEFTPHQHCGSATFLLTDGEKFEPITRHGDVEKFMDVMKGVYALASKGSKTRAKVKMMGAMRYVDMTLIRNLLGGVLTKGSYDSLGQLMRKVVLVGCMHFMDGWNFDLERVERCCIHYAIPDGRIIPFCTMNTLHRAEVEKKFGKPIEGWKKGQVTA